MNKLYIILYLIGAILAYGRAYAEHKSRWFATVNFLGSWIALFIGCIHWHSDNFLQYRKY